MKLFSRSKMISNISLVTQILIFFVISNSIQAQGTWTSLSVSPSNSKNSIHFISPTVGWMAAQGGNIYKSTDGGNSWSAQVINASEFYTGIYFSSSSNGTVVGYAGKIYTTNNGGTTWVARTSSVAWDLLGVSYVSARKGFAVGASGTILTTNDTGNTWTSVSSGTFNWLQGIYFTDSLRGFIASEAGKIFKTVNGGSTWTLITSGISNSVTLNSIYFTSSARGWAAGGTTGPGGAGNIYRTTDSGATWIAQTVPSQIGSISKVAFTDSLNGWAVGKYSGTGMIKTTDGGVTWTTQTLPGNPGDFNALFFLNAYQGWAAHSNGTTYLYKNFPATISTLSASLVTAISATLGGSISDTGSTNVTERGVVYGLTAYPTTADTKVQIGTGIGSYSQSISGLTPSTIYHFRAYAKNGAGTTYGSDSFFTTLPVTIVIKYVSPSGAGTKDGSSWANAIDTTGFPTALSAATLGTQFWVKAGTYKPTYTTNRNATFTLPSGVQLYGGFAGTEALLSQRNYKANVTTLSGDIGTIGSNSDNTYQIVTIINVSNTTIVDGLTITAANNNQGISPIGGGMIIATNGANNTCSPTISNCSFIGNQAGGTGGAEGAAIYYSTFSSASLLTLNNCLFSQNNVTGSSGYGGALDLKTGNLSCNSCVFSGNAAGRLGGAVFSFAAIATFSNCLFVNNSSGSANGNGGAFSVNGGGTVAIINSSLYGNYITSSTSNGGAIRVESGTTVNVSNSILYNNSYNSTTNSGPGSDISSAGTTTVNNCITQAFGTNGVNGNKVGANPLFVSTTNLKGADSTWATSDDGLQLQSGSPAKDSASATGAPGTDIVGTSRPQGTGYDMGAYELPVPTTIPQSIANLKLWLDASDVTNTGTNPSNNSTITTWKDRSGFGNDATLYPGKNGGTLQNSQINGQPVVHFTKTGDTTGTVFQTLGVDIRAGTMPQTTIFTVYKQGTQSAPLDQAIWGCDDGAWDRFFFSSFPGFPGSANDGGVSQGTFANKIINSGVVGVTQLLTAVYNSTVSNGSAVYFNGQQVATFTDATTLTAAKPTLRIGWDGDNNCYNGDIAEMLVYNRKLTDCEIQTVNRYLGAKYGVAFASLTIDTSGSTTIDNGSSVTLTAHNTGTAYQWIKNGSVISGANSRNYPASASGTYRVIVTNACNDTSAVQTVTVIPKPLLITSAATALASHSATLGGNVTDTAGSTVTERGIVYATIANPTTTTGTKVQIGAGLGIFSQNKTGLAASTTYHVRAYAINSSGTGYGADSTFTTLANVAPSVTTLSTSAITRTAATLAGNVTDSGGVAVTERGIVYSTTANPTTSTGTKVQIGLGIGTYTQNVTGLTAATLYHVRAYAINSVGTGYGADSTFTTLANTAPTVSTSSPAAIAKTTALLGGNVTDSGGVSVTERGIVYATTASPTTSTGTKVQIGLGIGTFSQSITGLTASTTYHVRAYAINSVGTSYGADSTFTTLANAAPTVTTSSPAAVAKITALLGGNVTDSGGVSVTERGIVYATTANPTTATGTKVQIGSGIGIFSQSVTGLTASTTYHIRAYAINSVGTSYGADSSFTTLAGAGLPTVTTSRATSIASSSATLGGNVVSDGGATVTERGVVFALTISPTTSDSKVAMGSGTGIFSQAVTALTVATNYHVRAYAINSVGTSYGADSTFTTLSALEKPTNAFTPNGDGLNDTWFIDNAADLKDHEIVVYNIFGQEVFHQTGYDIPWDGKKDGVSLPTAEYYYMIKGPKVNLKGALLIKGN